MLYTLLYKTRSGRKVESMIIWLTKTRGSKNIRHTRDTAKRYVGVDALYGYPVSDILLATLAGNIESGWPPTDVRMIPQTYERRVIPSNCEGDIAGCHRRLLRSGQWSEVTSEVYVLLEVLARTGGVPSEYYGQRQPRNTFNICCWYLYPLRPGEVEFGTRMTNLIGRP